MMPEVMCVDVSRDFYPGRDDDDVDDDDDDV